MELTIRPTTEMENLYTYTQSTQIQGQTGCIGHLRADMDNNGEGFFSTWDDHRGYLKTDIFKAEFDEVINTLRFGSGDENGIRKENEDCFLANRTALASFCYAHPSARMREGEEDYGFRVDTDAHAYMMRLNPNKGMYNLYCYCYRKDWLNQHLKNAEKGIRFIDSHYNNLFKIPDGGKIKVTYHDGRGEEFNCRYIDEYHMELEDIGKTIFHICEFAEWIEKNGSRVEPETVMPEKTKKARNIER